MQPNNNLTIPWKTKAIQRGKMIKMLNKRIRELNNSRDNWKEKYTLQKQEADKLRKHVINIKKKMDEIIQE